MVARPHPHWRHRCLDHRVLTVAESKWLVDSAVKYDLQVDPRHMPYFIDSNWDEITRRFNAWFGKPHRTKKQLLCAVEGVGSVEEFWTPYDKAYAAAVGKDKHRKARRGR